MKRTSFHMVIVALFTVATATSVVAQSNGWSASFDPVGEPPGGHGCTIGAYSSMQDGWDGWNPVNTQGIPSAFLLLYRENGPSWAGPTGFYASDLESPIPFGGSKTWRDMYLWSQGWIPPDNVMTVWVNNAYRTFILRAVLVLDYVPDSLGWTGPREYELDMNQDYFIPLPVPTVTDPLQGTRMHVTVYAIPEPSCLAVIGLGLVAIGPIVRRKRN